MSFDAGWLALREPADHAARAPEVTLALARRFAGRDAVSVADLGCGTGSTVRALAPHLPARQHWTLVDHDAALLAAALGRLAAWSDAASREGDVLTLRKGVARLTIEARIADLAATPLPVAAELVTCSALLDLVSAAWLARFAAELRAAGACCHAALTYDGTERWEPPHPLDAGVHAAFLSHMRRDKGFGPALGGAAAEAALAAFGDAGFSVVSGASAWRLGGAADAALMAETAAGIASAAAETGALTPGDAATWAAARRAATAASIGHLDLFAVP